MKIVNSQAHFNICLKIPKKHEGRHHSGLHAFWKTTVLAKKPASPILVAIKISQIFRLYFFCTTGVD